MACTGGVATGMVVFSLMADKVRVHVPLYERNMNRL
jgi:hypothetical protein